MPSAGVTVYVTSSLIREGSSNKLERLLFKALMPPAIDSGGDGWQYADGETVFCLIGGDGHGSTFLNLNRCGLNLNGSSGEGDYLI